MIVFGLYCIAGGVCGFSVDDSNRWGLYLDVDFYFFWTWGFWVFWVIDDEIGGLPCAFFGAEGCVDWPIGGDFCVWDV